MVGIQSYGAYVPIYRLSREEMAKVWGSGSRKGEKAIANCDEDSITMAVEAVLDCLSGIDRKSVDGLYFASTTPPYLVKSSASIVAAAADLRQDIFTADFTSSFSAGASALRAALDAVAAGSAKKVVVVSSEAQIPPPNSTSEPTAGDGAAALLVSNTDIAVNVEKQYAVSSDVLDIWRNDRGDRYNRTWEDRFVIEYGYMAPLQEAISNLLKNAGLSSKNIAKFAYNGPEARSHGAIVRALRLEKEQVQDPMFDVLGNTGAAFFMMILIAALEKAKAGDNIVTATSGDGANAFLLKVTDGIKNIKDRRGIEHHLASKIMLPNYGTYLRFRDLMEWEKNPQPDPESSVTVMWRDDKALIRGYGHKCKVCGHLQFPPQRICMWCQAVKQFEDVRFSDRKGKLFTYSLDERAVFALDLPNVIAIVDMDGGGRVYGQMTDRDIKKIEIGMPVELTFRKFHEGADFHNYSWKCRPVRC